MKTARQWSSLRSEAPPFCRLPTEFPFSPRAPPRGVDGCANKHEPGYEHMEWLRIQLQILRERGMKAILIGHVPPARTDSKESWDETCWQKFTLWERQYRDIIVGSLFGHSKHPSQEAVVPVTPPPPASRITAHIHAHTQQHSASSSSSGSGTSISADTHTHTHDSEPILPELVPLRPCCPDCTKTLEEALKKGEDRDRVE